MLAGRSELLVLDHALDPKSTEAIEELIARLKERRTIVLVTQNLGQTRRVTDWVACLCVRVGTGEVVETACCDTVFSNPQCREVANYLNRAIRMKFSE